MLTIAVMSYFFFFMQRTAYEMRISVWSSDVCSSDLHARRYRARRRRIRIDRPVIPLLLLALQGVPAPSIDSHGSAELPAIQETARPATIDWDMLAPLTYLEPPTLTPPKIRRAHV